MTKNDCKLPEDMISIVPHSASARKFCQNSCIQFKFSTPFSSFVSLLVEYRLCQKSAKVVRK